MPTKKCIVQGCGARTEVFGCLCESCYMSLCSGIIAKKTKSFLKCIPWMRNKLIQTRTLAETPGSTIEAVKALLSDVEAEQG